VKRLKGKVASGQLIGRGNGDCGPPNGDGFSWRGSRSLSLSVAKGGFR